MEFIKIDKCEKINHIDTVYDIELEKNHYFAANRIITHNCFKGLESLNIYDEKLDSRITLTMEDFVHKFIAEDSTGEFKIDDSTYYIEAMGKKENLISTKIIGVLKKYNEYNVLYKVSTDSNYIEITPDHLIKVKNQGTIDELSSMDLYNEFNKEGYIPNIYVPVKTTNTKYEWVKIESIEEIPHNGFVYDIELEENHYFPANRIISHNCRLRSNMFDEEYIIENMHGDKFKVRPEELFEVILEDGSRTEMCIREIIEQGLEEKIDIIIPEEYSYITLDK